MGLKEVTIRIGPDPSLLRIVRLAASSLATDVGFTVHEIDDLVLAVDELVSALLETAEQEVEISLRADKVSVTIRGRAPGMGAIELGDLAKAVLDQTADLYDIEPDGDVPSFSMVKVRDSAAA